VVTVAEVGANGGTVDNEKTIIEKLTDAVKGAANSIVDAASNAAETGTKSNAVKVAGTGNQQIFIPEATDAVAMPIPFTVPRSTRKKRKTPATPAPAKIPRKKAAARKTPRKSSAKKAKSGAGRKAVTKKSVAKKKKTNKSRR
jgi:hypothetical protein